MEAIERAVIRQGTLARREDPTDVGELMVLQTY
jgi:hypothetical protein